MDQAIAGGSRLTPTATRHPHLPWLAAIAATLALILIVNPVGFVGGGWDDWQYLNAARCWVEHGPCLPRDHWQGRWPVIAPIAATIGLFGESRLTVGLPSLLYALGCLFLLARLGNALARPPAGYIAALILLVMPVFGVELLGPNAEHPELFFLLAAANFIHGYVERRGAWLAFAVGLSWSLAFQVRETAIAALPLLALAAWRFARTDYRALAAAALGTALPVLAELLIFFLSSGDPLWRRQLSVAHTQIPSSELLGPIDRSRPPFLNPQYIANWRHQPGIHLHWSIDGLANLVINAMAGVGILLSIVFGAICWPKLDRADRRLVGALMLTALYWASFLIYVLAIDPKARMMFVPVALTGLALAVLLVRIVRISSMRLAIIGLGLCWLVGMTIIAIHQQFWSSERYALRWAAQYPGKIETDPTTERHLTLIDAADDFAKLTSDRPMLAVKLDMHCQKWADENFADHIRLVERSPLSQLDKIVPGMGGNFCLFRYLRPTSPLAVIEAKERQRN